jgi:hypothetical protein
MRATRRRSSTTPSRSKATSTPSPRRSPSTRAPDADTIDDSETDASSECGVVSFETDVQPILTTDCALTGCHVGPSPAGNLLLADGFSYSYLVNAPSTEVPSMKRVVPGSPCESVLVLKMGWMPSCAGSAAPGSHYKLLTAAEVDRILCWIEGP